MGIFPTNWFLWLKKLPFRERNLVSLEIGQNRNKVILFCQRAWSGVHAAMARAYAGGAARLPTTKTYQYLAPLFDVIRPAYTHATLRMQGEFSPIS